MSLLPRKQTMAHSPIHRIVHSVFTRLLIICLVAGLAIIFIVGVFSARQFGQSARANLQKNIIQYLNYVINDLGEPPSLARAKEITKASALQIRYESPEVTWTTSDKIPPVRELKLKILQQSPLVRYRIRHETYTVTLQHGPGVFVFVLNPEHILATGWELWLVLLIALLTGIVSVIYLAIRHNLKPLKFLSEGVRQISDGHLDHQVPRSRLIEFDQLAEAFNTMTIRIRSMLHAKEQLLLDVSHELRSPLTRMKIALEMLPDGQMKENMKDDVREMEMMVSEILEAARLRNAAGELKCETIPAFSLLKDISDLYKNNTPGLQIDPVPEDAYIHGDPMLIKIVLNNIISNAIKYSPVDGEPVRLTWIQNPDSIVIQVRDQGQGIPADELPYIFEPFYRVDKSRSKRTGSYGLGLSLCKTIMEAHRGRIEVQSSPGNGATFSLYFPT
ncbi:MAG: HAMP domain-containing sensor histidine kinase [Syntrophaceae bacterium]